MKAPTDEELLKGFLKGNTASFELLVRRHSTELYQFLYRMTGDTAAAEDVVQETFLQLYRSAKDFDGSRRLKPWVFTIAANKARDSLRKSNRLREVSYENLQDEVVGGGRRFLELLAAQEEEQKDEFPMEERRRMVRECLIELSENHREIIVLAYYHTFSYRDISEITGLLLGTVKSRLHSAILSFARKYQEKSEAAQNEN